MVTVVVVRRETGPEQSLNRFDQALQERGVSLVRGVPEVLQINVGKLCNLTCTHCHVNAGPKRKEVMTRETVERLLEWLRKTEIKTVDLTGGAPEMIPDFRYLVSEIKAMGRHVMDRCNLTINLSPAEPGLQTVSAEQPGAPRRFYRLCVELLP